MNVTSMIWVTEARGTHRDEFIPATKIQLAQEIKLHISLLSRTN